MKVSWSRGMHPWFRLHRDCFILFSGKESVACLDLTSALTKPKNKTEWPPAQGRLWARTHGLSCRDYRLEQHSGWLAECPYFLHFRSRDSQDRISGDLDSICCGAAQQAFLLCSIRVSGELKFCSQSLSITSTWTLSSHICASESTDNGSVEPCNVNLFSLFGSGLLSCLLFFKPKPHFFFFLAENVCSLL